MVDNVRGRCYNTEKGVMKMKTKELTYGGVCVALIAICAWITIPTGAAPFTMQTFGVFFTLFFLGGRLGSGVVLAYLLLGAVGAPVFAGFQGGLSVLFGTTGGYLLGFLAISLLFWLVNPGEKKMLAIATMIVGQFLCYLLGTLQFVAIYSQNTGEIGIWTVLTWCVLPYILPDMLKLFLAQQMAQRLRFLQLRNG